MEDGYERPLQKEEKKKRDV